jgi:hypothetical protein
VIVRASMCVHACVRMCVACKRIDPYGCTRRCSGHAQTSALNVPFVFLRLGCGYLRIERINALWHLCHPAHAQARPSTVRAPISLAAIQPQRRTVVDRSIDCALLPTVGRVGR